MLKPFDLPISRLHFLMLQLLELVEWIGCVGYSSDIIIGADHEHEHNVNA